MAAKIAQKKAPTQGPVVKMTKRACFECGSKLMSDGIYTYREIVFTGLSKRSLFRYTCKQHTKRTNDGKK
jgi:hypothetical protein